MADKTTAISPAAYVPGDDPEAMKANQVYQDALRKLNESLDLRKNRRFDPQMLAMAQGFLAPTKTGSFMESLGRVAGSVGEAQEKSIAEQQEEARQRLAVAQSGLELQRLRQREKILLGGQGGAGGAPGMPGMSGMPPPGEPAPSAAQPGGLTLAQGPGAQPAAGGLPGPAAAPQGGGLPASKPAGFEGVEGVQITPPNPNFVDRNTFIRAAMLNQKKDPQDILKEWEEMEQKRYQVKESGVHDIASGKFYAFPRAELVEREINGKTYKVDGRTATLLDMFRSMNDPRYWSIADQVIRGPQRPGAAPSGAAGARPAAGAQAAAPGASDTEEVVPLRSETEKEVAKTEATTRAQKLAEAAAAKEAGIKQFDSNARNIYGIASRVQNVINQSGDFLGIFQRPGLTRAVLNVVQQGLQTPTGTINIPGLQQAVTQVLPKVTQADLDNLQNATADLAELELIFSRTFLSGQGQVTQGERAIVQKVPGTVSNSPEVLRVRMTLLQKRSQRDMDIAQAWDQWEKKNPGQSFLKFERSKDYKTIEENYEKDLARMNNTLPALPSSQRSSAATPPSSGASSGLEAARARVRKELEQR